MNATDPQPRFQAPQSGPNVQAQLQALIDSQSELVRNLKAVMARNPALEYTQREASVGATPNFLPCPKYECDNQFIANAVNQWVFTAGIYVQFWRLGLVMGVNNLAAELNSHFGVKLEFDYDPSFGRPTTLYVPFALTQNISSYTANTGDRIYTLDKVFPIRHRCLRVSFGWFVMGAGNGSQFISRDIQNYASGATPLTVERFGE